MQKVYLLLRDNQQTGPHSIEELLRLQLRPKDLIWVEGKSSGWSYPGEVEALKPFVGTPVPEKPQAADHSPYIPPSHPEAERNIVPRKIFVSFPVSAASPGNPAPSLDPIEEKAEELRRRIQSYNTQGQPQANEIRTNYTRSPGSLEEDYTTWVFQKRTGKKGFKPKHAIITGILVAGLAGGWWIGKAVFNEPREYIPKPVAGENPQQIVTGENTIAEQFVSNPTEEISVPPEKPVMGKQEKKKQESHIKAGKKAEPEKDSAEPVFSNEDEQETSAEASVPETAKESEAAPAEKKRTLRGLISGIFRKKNKEEQRVDEPGTASGDGQERKSTRRDAGNEAPQVVDISEKVEVRMNRPGGDWMMGVQGVKLTLFNRSTANLKFATLELLYYSEQHELLDKKILQFSNISAGRSQVLPAPDHRLADRVEFRLLSASGIVEAYARQ